MELTIQNLTIEEITVILSKITTNISNKPLIISEKFSNTEITAETLQDIILTKLKEKNYSLSDLVESIKKENTNIDNTRLIFFINSLINAKKINKIYSSRNKFELSIA